MINRTNNMTIEEIKQEIEKLKGKKILMSVNQGRKKFVNFEGIIQDTYKSIFVVKLIENKITKSNDKITNNSSAIDKLQKVIEENSTKNQHCIIDSVDNKIELTRREPEDKNTFYDTPPIIETPKPTNVDLRTYSYIDILCGNVDIDGFMSR